MTGKSMANGNGNSFANGPAGKPPEVAAAETNFWKLVEGDPAGTIGV